MRDLYHQSTSNLDPEQARRRSNLFDNATTCSRLQLSNISQVALLSERGKRFRPRSDYRRRDLIRVSTIRVSNCATTRKPLRPLGHHIRYTHQSNTYILLTCTRQVKIARPLGLHYIEQPLVCSSDYYCTTL